MKRYRAEIGDKKFDFEIENHHVSLNGEALSYSFEPLGNGCFSLLLDNKSVPVFVQETERGTLHIVVHGTPSEVSVKDDTDLLLERFGMSQDAPDTASELHAPMPGLVLSIAVQEGETVSAGEPLLVLEAMKMENELRAIADVTIEKVHVEPGDAVLKNALLISFSF